jgi:hypothetical protein
MIVLEVCDTHPSAMSIPSSISRLCYLPMLLITSCSPAGLDHEVEAPVVVLSAEQPTAAFEVQFCTKERPRGHTDVTGGLRIDGLQASDEIVEDLVVRVNVEEGPSLDYTDVVLDRSWQDSLRFEVAGPWSDQERGCSPIHRVTFELLDPISDETVDVHWSVGMHLSYFKKLKGKNRFWEEQDLEIHISAV